MISFNIVAGDGVSFSVGNGNSVSFEVQPIAHSIPAGGSDGQVLAKASNTDFDVEWVDMTGGGGSSTLDGLTDVTITTVASGNFLRYNGTQWVNTTIQASDLPTGIDAAKIADGNVSNAEFQYLNGVTSAIQTQLDNKADEGTAVAFTSVNINGTGGNGHIHLKHQSADPSVSASNTGLWAAADGELYAKNDGNAKTKLLTAAQIGTDVQAYSSVLANTTASFTTADETKLDGIEALADVTDAGNVGSVIDGATAKTTPVDGDTMPLIDSAASNVLKKVTWANIKATLKTYFDTLYQAAGSYLTSANITQTITNGVTDKAPSEDAVFDALAGKQATLVSGTNIKTVNGSSLLGSGDLSISSGGTDLATVGDSFIYETDFYAQSIPDGLTAHISGAGAGFSYSNTMVEGRPGFAFPSPGTSSGAFSGRAHICPTVDIGPTTGWTVDAGELDMTFIVQTASLAQSGTEDYFDIFGLSNSFFNPNPDNSVAITRQQGVNSGNWIFRYRTTSNQVTINGSSGSATSTWFVLRFKVAASTHACEFWINGVSQGTGTPASKITALNHAALYLGVAKVASAGGEPRPRWDYFRVQQNLNRN